MLRIFQLLEAYWFKDTLKAFDNFKNKINSVWSNVFWYVKVCNQLWKFIQYTIHWDKTQMLKKIPLDKINGTKNDFFFLLQSPTHTVLRFILICDSYMSWSIRLISLKSCVGPSIFDSVSFFLKFIFLFNKIHELFDFKMS